MTKPVVLTTGFVALDVIRSAYEPHLRLAVGGSCGNVSATLAMLGYDVRLQAKLGTDSEGRFALAGLSGARVGIDGIRFDASVRTPVVIHEVLPDTNRGVDHRFILTAPRSGRRLPRFCSIDRADVQRVIRSGLVPRLFYFDRLSPAIIELVKWAKDNGAITFFEPSDIRADIAIDDVEPYIDILKVSAERIHELDGRMRLTSPVRILTAGREGLIVYFGQSTLDQLPAIPVAQVVDSAGAGDAVTSLLIAAIMDGPARGLPNPSVILSGLRRGQRLAALNCVFPGARGALECLGPNLVRQFVDHLPGAEQLASAKRYRSRQTYSTHWPRDDELERLYS